MGSCWLIRRDLTAWIDGALSTRRADRVRRHLARCPTCSNEAAELRASIARQRAMLAHVTAMTDFDPRPLRLRLQGMLSDEPADDIQYWTWRFPVAFAGAALVVAVGTIFIIAGGPRAVLIPLGVQPPPPAVTRSTDLFKNYPIIEHLDALENFDTVESVPLDEDEETHRG